MSSCTTCGGALPDGARFCPACGTPVQALPRIEERRTVTILFVDLVGFTERSDQADPEDVRRTLVPFHAAVKEDLERFGGTLDKFIGDAVMGVFGAPIAHEDDPIRAVRAALAILRSIEGLQRTDPQLRVRIAVNTGEAVVAFGVGPQIGEAVAGDVVNTASRMQALAPHDAVVVGEATLRALRDQFDVEELAPATVKGKVEPLTVWRVVAERAAADIAPPVLVGRDRELAALEASFERVLASGSVRCVTIVAGPGLGKSRLVRELEERLTSKATALTATCPPYGQGVTFAPMAETLRTLAGVGMQDAPDVVVAHLETLATRAEEEPGERRWLVSRLSLLMGIGTSDHEGAAPAGELAMAWVEALKVATESGPLLLVVEDLHWGEPAFVEVLEAAESLLAGTPALVIVTARPELADRHPGWLEARDAAIAIELAPLTSADTAGLLGDLLGRIVGSGPTTDELVERIAGNPLYALEFARMLRDRVHAGTEPTTPESVQAVIAARLDAIPPDLRGLTLDASVIGGELWPEALAELGHRSEEDARADVEDLVRRGILERRPSSLLGLAGYRFSHSLIREVAYARLPRTERARRHLATAEWLEKVFEESSDPHPEMVARHFASAAELGAAAGVAGVAAQARPAAVRWLKAAAERANLVDAGGAFAFYDRALRLVPERTAERIVLLERSGVTGRQSEALDGAGVLQRYEETLSIARELDDPVLIGDALTRMGSQLGATGEPARSREALDEAIRVLGALPPGRALGRAYAYRAEEELFAGHTQEARRLADLALTLLGDEDEYVTIMSLHIRGDARCSMGDEAGLEDLWEALRIALASDHASAITISHNYLGPWLLVMEGPGRAMAEFEAGLEVADRRGLSAHVHWSKSGLAETKFEAGQWDEALALADEMIAAGDRMDPAVLVKAHVIHARIAVGRGRPDDAIDPGVLLDLARKLEEPQAVGPALSVAAQVAVAAGRPLEALPHVEEFERVTRDVSPEYRALELGDVVWCAVAAGNLDLADVLVAGSTCRARREVLQLRKATAAIAEARGEDAVLAYGELAEGWRGYGNPHEEALALAGRVRCLVTAGRAGEGAADLRRAADLLASLGAPADDPAVSGPPAG